MKHLLDKQSAVDCCSTVVCFLGWKLYRAHCRTQVVRSRLLPEWSSTSRVASIFISKIFNPFKVHSLLGNILTSLCLLFLLSYNFYCMLQCFSRESGVLHNWIELIAVNDYVNNDVTVYKEYINDAKVTEITACYIKHICWNFYSI